MGKFVTTGTILTFPKENVLGSLSVHLYEWPSTYIL